MYILDHCLFETIQFFIKNSKNNNKVCLTQVLPHTNLFDTIKSNG